MIDQYKKIYKGKEMYYNINYEIVACRKCGEPVKMSSSSIKSLNARGINPICITCKYENSKKYGRDYNKKHYVNKKVLKKK